MRRNMVWGLCIVAGLVIFVGLGPILVAHIVDRLSTAREKILDKGSEEARKSLKEEVSAPLILRVSGNLSLIKEKEEQLLILSTDAGKNYLLVGPKIEQLKTMLGEKVTVMGRIKRPLIEEVGGKTIRFIIDVTKIIP